MKTVLLSLLMLSQFANGTGGMTSTGGDAKAFGWESAWFLGKDAISYCIDIAPTEKLTKAQAKSDFESVVATWQKYYLERYHRNKEEKYHLNFNYRYEECSPQTLLKIYVGVDNRDIQEGKKLFTNPYAFATRQEYDLAKGMGKGFLWFMSTSNRPKEMPIIPDWSTPYAFHGVLLHEMGHVYGCGHVAQTIMREDLISDLQLTLSDDPFWAAGGKMYMTNIDHHHYLIQGDSQRMLGRVHPDHDFGAIRTGEVFEKLSGRKPVGEVTAEFSNNASGMKVTYKDKAGVIELPLTIVSQSRYSVGDSPIFSSFRDNEGHSTSAVGSNYVAQLTTKTGEKALSVIDINSDDISWPVSVKVLLNGKMEYAFYADLWLFHGIVRK